MMWVGRGGRRGGRSGGVIGARAVLLPAGIRGVGEVSLYPRGNFKRGDRNSGEEVARNIKESYDSLPPLLLYYAQVAPCFSTPNTWGFSHNTNPQYRGVARLRPV